jgi:hypothetical protein
MGRDVSGIDHPETYYDLSDPTHQKEVPNLVRDPVTNRLVDRFTGQPHPEAEGYTPASQAKFPRADPVTSVAGSETWGGPVLQGHRDKNGNWVADIDKHGNKVYAPAQFVQTPGGPTGVMDVPRLPNTPVPPPRPSPKTAKEIEEEAGDAASEQALSKTSQDPSQRDPLYAQEILSTMQLPDNVKALARRKLDAQYRAGIADPNLKFKWGEAQRKRSKPKTQPPPGAQTGAQPAATPAAPAKVKILD